MSITSHGTVGWDGHLGFGVLCMRQLGIPIVCPLLPTVQWDGMDTWDLGYCAWDSLGFPQCVHYFPWYSGMGWTLGIWDTVHGTAWDSHSVSITSHGTVG